MEYMPGTLLTISEDDADTLAQEEIPKSEMAQHFSYETPSWSNYVFDDGNPVTSDDMIQWGAVPADTTFTFVQEPAIYLRS